MKDDKSASEPEAQDVVYSASYVPPEFGEYVFFGDENPDIGQKFAVPKEDVDEIWGLYSSGLAGSPGWTKGRIAEEFQCPEEIIDFILKSMHMRHKDTISPEIMEKLRQDGLSEHEIDEKAGDELRKRAQQIARIKVRHQDHLSKLGRKWLEFEQGTLEPIKEVLSSLELPKVHKIKKVSKPDLKNLPTGCALLNDVHFGDSTEREMLFNSPEFDIDTVIGRIKSYADQIVQLARENKISSEEIYVFALGDLLDSLSGFTFKGTPLEPGVKGKQQYKKASEALLDFLTRICLHFNRVHIHYVKGNHDPVGDYAALERAAAILDAQGLMHYDDFVGHTDSRWGEVEIRGCAVLYEHGYSEKYRSKVPKSGKPRESYIQSLMLNSKVVRPDIEGQPRFFLCGDMHTTEYTEKNNFDFVRAGAIVNPNQYAHDNNWRSRPSQTVLALTEKGAVAKYTVYFDE